MGGVANQVHISIPRHYSQLEGFHHIRDSVVHTEVTQQAAFLAKPMIVNNAAIAEADRGIMQIPHTHTTGCVTFHLMVPCVVHAREGLACHAHRTPASSPASHCTVKPCSALTSPSLRAHGSASSLRTCFYHKNYVIIAMCPKLRYPPPRYCSSSTSYEAAHT